jgi:hypothetical protein
LRFGAHKLFPFPASILLAGMVCAKGLAAQETPERLQQPDFSSDFQNAQVSRNSNAPCVQPTSVVRLEDYEGPMKKTVGFFARALERKAVHPPRYLPGVYLCSLGAKDKFVLFVEDSFNPVAFLDSGFNAGLDQASSRDPTFRQGIEGYAKRLGANFADQTSSKFFKDFAFPVLFAEDPRYYRIAHGPFQKRLLHAVGHSFIAYRVDGTRIFNSSEWLGTTSAVVLSNAYHPGNARGTGAGATRVGFAVLQDMGFDVLREFWPEVSRKLNLPFRGSREIEPAEKVPWNN